MSQFPRKFRDRLKDQLLFDNRGREINPLRYGFYEDMDLEVRVRGLWVIEKEENGHIGCTGFDKDSGEIIDSDALGIFESHNLLEVFHWLTENHSRPGFRWNLSGREQWATFELREYQPENLEELQDLLLVFPNRTFRVNESVEQEVLTKEYSEIPVDERKIYAVLLPHPEGGSQMIYIWQSDFDTEWRGSLKMPRNATKRKPTVASKMYERLHEAMRECSHIVQNMDYSVSTNYWCSGADYPSKFSDLVKSIKFIRDHKHWEQNCKRLQKPIKLLLESLENRDAVRRLDKVAKAEAFLKKLTGVRLRKVKPSKIVVKLPELEPV